MRETSYPKPVAEVIATLIEICRHQKQTQLLELLENSHSHFEAIGYDNWNGGTTTWALRLGVPTFLFAIVQPQLSAVETELSRRLSYLDRLNPNDPLGEVTITPIESTETALGQRMAPSDTDVRRLWRDGYLRLFISHVSQHRVQVSALKNVLHSRGVSAFVAHEDIEPSLEWQNEIALALRSMHALTALITSDFHASYWTDQEVGWALGRGIVVLPVRLGANPYGFMGKVQAIPGSLDEPSAFADSLVQALLRNSQTHGQMRRALVEAFENADSFLGSKRLRDIVVKIDDFTNEEKDRLRVACTENSQVSGSWGVVDAIYEAFGRPRGDNSMADDEVPF